MTTPTLDSFTFIHLSSCSYVINIIKNNGTAVMKCIVRARNYGNKYSSIFVLCSSTIYGLLRSIHTHTHRISIGIEVLSPWFVPLKFISALNKDRNFCAINHLNGAHIRFDDRKCCFISVNLSSWVRCSLLRVRSHTPMPARTHLPKRITLQEIFISRKTSVIIIEHFPLFRMFCNS